MVAIGLASSTAHKCGQPATHLVLKASRHKYHRVHWALWQKLRGKSVPVTGPVWPRGWVVVALLFHDRSNRKEWVVSSMPWPHFTPGKDPVPIVQEAGWAPGPVWTGGKSRPHWDLIPDRPAHSQSLYRLSYPSHEVKRRIQKIM